MDMKSTHADVVIDLANPGMPTTLQNIRQIIDGFKNFQALRAGLDSGLFDWLEQHGPAEKSVISADLRLRGAHLSAFLQTLEDLGLLVRQNNAYSLAPMMNSVLCKTGTWFQGEMLGGLLAPTCGWSDMTHFMSEKWKQTATSLPPLSFHPFLGEATLLASHLAEKWRKRAPHSLLCFDSGDGLLTAALCHHFPEARITLVAMPDALPRAEAMLTAHGLNGHCQALPGTPLDPPVLEEFDCAVLYHSLYTVRKSVDIALTAVADSLARDGELCSAHWFCLEACESAPGGLRDLDKAVLIDSHPLCHVETFGERMAPAGMSYEGREDIAGPYGNLKLHFAMRARTGAASSSEHGCGC